MKLLALKFCPIKETIWNSAQHFRKFEGYMSKVKYLGKNNSLKIMVKVHFLCHNSFLTHTAVQKSKDQSVTKANHVNLQVETCHQGFKDEFRLVQSVPT